LRDESVSDSLHDRSKCLIGDRSGDDCEDDIADVEAAVNEEDNYRGRLKAVDTSHRKCAQFAFTNRNPSDTYVKKDNFVSPKFGGVISKVAFKLVMKRMHFADPAELCRILSVLLHLNCEISELISSLAEHFSGQIPYVMEGMLVCQTVFTMKPPKFGIKLMNCANPFLIFMVLVDMHG
jgi:hypothetical protein